MNRRLGGRRVRSPAIRRQVIVGKRLRMPPVSYYLRLSLYTSAMGFASACGVGISIIATLLGQRLNINWYVARLFYRLASPLVGIKCIVEGEEHLKALMSVQKGEKAKSAVLLGNHQSFLDILYLGRIFPQKASIMAKKELKWVPFLGQFMALSGAVFVNRKNQKSAIAAMSRAGEDMKRRGISLWIFPEGTRSSTPEPTLLPFKKGAFHLAVQAGVPIIPIVCENYHHLFDGRSRFRSGTIVIRVLPPIETAGLEPQDVSALVERTRDCMLAALVDISAGQLKRTTSETRLTADMEDYGSRA